MQCKRKCKDSFVKTYPHVLIHHMNCIMESQMLLDEDLYLLLTFWNPAAIADIEKSNASCTTLVACSVSTITSAILSLKLRKLHYLIASASPLLLFYLRKANVAYYNRKYRNNCESLIAILSELHRINRNILEYTRTLNRPKLPENWGNVLQTKRCNFLKFVINMVMEVLQALIEQMHEINKRIPIIEVDYMYAATWDLNHIIPSTYSDLSEMQHCFDNLTDLTVLVVSNFLACVGLTFCIELWKETPSRFNTIFDEIIPGLCRFVTNVVRSITDEFNIITSTLSCDTLKTRVVSRKSNAKLDDFLYNVQALFEVSSELRRLLETDQCNDALPVVFENVTEQFVKCRESLEYASRSLYFIPKSNLVEPSVSTPQVVTFAEIHHGDDPEEYNLSIHNSDAGDDIAPIFDYADQCSYENLELMLVELKRKLEERKGKTECAIEDNESVSIPPPPPPPLMIPCLPSVNDSHREFLNAVRTVAKSLGQEEEVFGCNADF